MFTTLKASGVTLNTPLPSSSGGTGLSSYGKGTLLTGTALGGLRSVPAADSDGLYLTRGPDWLGGTPVDRRRHELALLRNHRRGPASNTDAINFTISNKALVPSNLPYVFATPPTVGGTTPNAGVFRNVNVGGTSSCPRPCPWRRAASECRPRRSETSGGINNAYGRLPVGVDGYILQANPPPAPGLKWVVPPKAADPTNVKEVITALPGATSTLARQSRPAPPPTSSPTSAPSPPTTPKTSISPTLRSATPAQPAPTPSPSRPRSRAR